MFIKTLNNTLSRSIPDAFFCRVKSRVFLSIESSGRYYSCYYDCIAQRFVVGLGLKGPGVAPAFPPDTPSLFPMRFKCDKSSREIVVSQRRTTERGQRTAQVVQHLAWGKHHVREIDPFITMLTL